jgi:signal transduction histidine kinase
MAKDNGRILVVDDEKEFAGMIKLRLEKNFYTVKEAYDGEEAVAKAKEEKPDLVLLDIKIPKIDGLQVLKTLMKANPGLYVVMVTGYASLESAIEAMRYGAHDYLIKPLEKGRLETVVKRCLEKARLSRELKEAQERLLIHAQKLSAIGQLTAGIVHEIKNPLTSIRGTVQLRLREKKIGRAERKDLKIVEEETIRCQEILKRLIGFSRVPEPEIVSVNINGIIDDTLQLLRPQAVLQRIKVLKKLAPQIPPVLGVGDQLKQVFLNLILNAFNAMPGGGDFTVTTLIKGKFVFIKFADTGCGISSENLKRLFDAFFTTGKKSGGAGLGLSISYGIIRKHNGTIEVESKVGKGTTFTVKLPLEKPKQV